MTIFDVQTNMNKYFISFLLVLFFSFHGNSQLEKNILKTFSIDSFNVINLNVFGDYEIEFWAGNNVLSETIVQLSQADGPVLDFFIREGRYELLRQTSGDQVTIQSKKFERPLIKTKYGLSTESVKQKFFIPDTFKANGDASFVRMESNN
jgi:hypothetical protein